MRKQSINLLEISDTLYSLAADMNKTYRLAYSSRWDVLTDLHTVLDGNAYLVMTYYVVVMVKD
jgi:hypothetical protein